MKRAFSALLKKSSLYGIPLIVILAAGGIFITKNRGTEQNILIIHPIDFVQQVSVSGKVVAAENVELAFEKSGRITEIDKRVGDSVTSGEILLRLDATNINAELNQAEANVKTQQAKLDELRIGTRPEEITLAKTSVTNAKKGLDDANINLTNTTQKAAVDLQNLYDGVRDILNDAYTKADDALNKQIDELFNNDTSPNPQLVFLSSDSQAQNDAQNQRYVSNNELAAFKQELTAISNSHDQLDIELTKSVSHLTVLRNFLARLADAVNGATGLSQATINTYKSDANTARTNINTAISEINGQIQFIAAQKNTNQNNIASAGAKVNDAQNALQVSENELDLKKAGATPETIKAQAAAVEEAIASADQIRAELTKTMLQSPINGIVTRVDAKIGEIASANTPEVSIISADTLQIESYVPEVNIALVSVGNEASVTLDAYGSGVPFRAKIISIDPAETVRDGVSTYKTKLQFADRDTRIKSGMTANVTVTTERKTNAIVVPQGIVFERNGQKFVKVKEGTNIVERKIETGLVSSLGQIQVLSGLADGDLVLLNTENK